MNAETIRLFQRCVYGWLAGYLLAVLALGTAAWTNAPVDLFHPGNGIVDGFQTGVNELPAWACMTLVIIAFCASLGLLMRHRAGLALVVWLLFRVIDHRMWLASNGGVQLMGTMLLWSCALTRTGTFAGTIAFWAARLQLILVYAVAIAHKFTGTTWVDGSAVQLVVADPTFHLRWLASFPSLCIALTYLTLGWMTLFPLAVWWRPARRTWLIIGASFHLATAVFMDIPQMGLAFIACYAIWLNEAEARWVMGLFQRRTRPVAA